MNPNKQTLTVFCCGLLAASFLHAQTPTPAVAAPPPSAPKPDLGKGISGLKATTIGEMHQKGYMLFNENKLSIPTDSAKANTVDTTWLKDFKTKIKPNLSNETYQDLLKNNVLPYDGSNLHIFNGSQADTARPNVIKVPMTNTEMLRVEAGDGGTPMILHPGENTKGNIGSGPDGSQDKYVTILLNQITKLSKDLDEEKAKTRELDEAYEKLKQAYLELSQQNKGPAS